METGACGYGGQDCGGTKGVTIFGKPDETEDSPKPKPRKPDKKNETKKGRINWENMTFFGGWNNPEYNTWNLLRQGAPCTACHVTHWNGRIPTNSELDIHLVNYYQSLRKTAQMSHWAAFSYIGTNVSLTRSTIVIGPNSENPNTNYVQVANRIGADYYEATPGLSSAEIAVENEAFIMEGIDDGARFIQSGSPTSPQSWLNDEIHWMERSGYFMQSDFLIETITYLGRTTFNLTGISTVGE